MTKTHTYIIYIIYIPYIPIHLYHVLTSTYRQWSLSWFPGRLHMSMPVFWEFDGICGAGVSETWMIDCTWFQTKQPPKSTLFAGPTVRGFNLEVSKISAAQSFLKIGYPSSSSGLKLYFPYSNLHDLGVIPPSPHFGTSQIYWLFHIYIDIYI